MMKKTGRRPEEEEEECFNSLYKSYRSGAVTVFIVVKLKRRVTLKLIVSTCWLVQGETCIFQLTLTFACIRHSSRYISFCELGRRFFDEKWTGAAI